MSRRVVEIIKDLSKDYLISNNIELVKIDFVKEGPNRFLRILIDKDKGISLKECEKFSRFLNKKIDDNMIKEKYYLEVSSPGVERELYNEKDYKKFIGDVVDIKLYHTIDGRKKVVGTLNGFTDTVFKIGLDDKEIELPRNKVAKINLHFDFDKGGNNE
ncbi:MAG: ribosome maturation factor RimP [Bacillota bacterium]